MAILSPAPTATRVQESTPREVNARIEHDTEVNLAEAARTPENIDRRLQELDQEWDIERVLQTNFGVANLVGITLGAFAARRWFLLTGVVAVFMGQHALRGWCPPMPVFRRLGFRTTREIAHERYALKALRGDFREVDRRDVARLLESANGSSGGTR